MDKRLDIRGGRIEDVLVADGKLTRDQIEEALRARSKDGRDLSEILLALGYVGKVDLAKALAKKLRLKYVEITEKSVDPQAAALLDRRLLRKHGVVPLRVEDGRLIVATSSPDNFYMLEDLTMLSGYPVTPVVAVEDDIERVLNRVFTIKQEVAELFEDGAGPALEEHPR
jgi:type IV pilus assembly protein PilB